jgi:transcription initiation factor TFIID subunit 2
MLNLPDSHRNPKVIHRAIDLETIHKRLSQGRYVTMESFANDYRFMIQTHRTASLPTSQLTACADILDTIFERAWAEAVRKTLNDDERLSLRIVLDKLLRPRRECFQLIYEKFTNFIFRSFFFREPVDPIAQGVPTYYDVIPKEEARDLRTIREKLDNDQYNSVDAFEVDMDLMFANAIKWGGAGSDFGKLSISLRRVMRNVLKEVNPRKKDRMDSGGLGPARPFTPLFSI